MDEVLSWPDDGNRYELVDGVLIVTPAPVPLHQVVSGRIARALADRLPGSAGAYLATPGAILIRPGIKMEPDVLVFRTPSLRDKWEEITDHWLAVEVFSLSSERYDREVKRDAYLQIGVREVWLVDTWENQPRPSDWRRSSWGLNSWDQEKCRPEHMPGATYFADPGPSRYMLPRPPAPLAPAARGVTRSNLRPSEPQPRLCSRPREPPRSPHPRSRHAPTPPADPPA